ncbi:MAG: hypothetical protein IJB90_05715 [Clostridia bacterium]|nr:hypothetical protein [Clostridia bacterium]
MGDVGLSCPTAPNGYEFEVIKTNMQYIKSRVNVGATSSRPHFKEIFRNIIKYKKWH